MEVAPPELGGIPANRSGERTMHPQGIIESSRRGREGTSADLEARPQNSSGNPTVFPSRAER